MHANDPVLIQQVSLMLFSAVGDGMHLEIADQGTNGRPGMSFREDEQLGLQVILHGAVHDSVLSLADLKRAIAMAEAEVHRESFYDES